MCNVKTKKLGVLGVAAGLTLAAASASAAIQAQVIDQVIHYGSASDPVSGEVVDLSYNDFDPALGQLTGIKVTLDSYDSAEAIVYSRVGAGLAYSDASVSGGHETVKALGLSTTARSLAAGPFHGRTTGAYTVAGTGKVQHLTASEMVLPWHFSSFIGLGTDEFTVSVLPGSGRFSGIGRSRLLGFGGAFESYGTVEIDYYYIASMVAVPEVSHFSFFTGGFAGLVALGGLACQIRRSKT